MENSKNKLPENRLIGFALFGLTCIGTLSAVGAFAAFMANDDYVGAGVLAIAAGLSFGQLLNGLNRN